MKSIWKGSISFGLVNIPIKLYSAIESKSFGFRLLCNTCKTPIKYKRWCQNCDKEVQWQDIIKGFEIRKNTFITVSKEQIEKLKPEKSDMIDIIAFTDSYQIEPIYLEKHYYISPDKSGEKAFFLFQEVLRSAAKTAIGRFVMREKEYTCAINAYKKGLLLTTLSYAYEVRDIDTIEELKEKPKMTKEELTLANQLISKLYDEKFDITAFKDTFSEKLREMLKKMEKGEATVVRKQPKLRRANLIQALKASLKEK